MSEIPGPRSSKAILCTAQWTPGYNTLRLFPPLQYLYALYTSFMSNGLEYSSSDSRKLEDVARALSTEIIDAGIIMPHRSVWLCPFGLRTSGVGADETRDRWGRASTFVGLEKSISLCYMTLRGLLFWVHKHRTIVKNWFNSQVPANLIE